VTCGHYVGGRFYIEIGPRQFRLQSHGRCWLFDGSLPHGHDDFQGERGSLVAFTHAALLNASPATLGSLRELGFPLPRLVGMSQWVPDKPKPSSPRPFGKSLWVPDGRDVAVPFPLCRPPSLPFRTTTCSETLVYEYWLRCAHRGGELRGSLDASSDPNGWPSAAVDSSAWVWRDCLSFAQSGEHINCLELRAAFSAFKWRLRTTNERSTIAFHLLDSQVAIASLAKGRSRSKRLNAVLKRINALKLVSGVSLFCGFVRSKDNPSDGPSRVITKIKRVKLRHHAAAQAHTCP
jgi:hypothetical protein